MQAGDAASAADAQAPVKNMYPVPDEMGVLRAGLRACAAQAAFRFLKHNLPSPCRLSGLWHHVQLMLQPLGKTVVRIPGPSSTENRWIPKIIPCKFSLFK